MPGMDRLNTCARIAIRCSIGSDRVGAYLRPIEAFLLDNWEERPLRDVAREFGVPEATLRGMVETVKAELAAACAAEDIEPAMLLAAVADG